MAQWSAKPDIVSSVPKTPMVKGENGLQDSSRLSLDLTLTVACVCLLVCTLTYK